MPAPAAAPRLSAKAKSLGDPVVRDAPEHPADLRTVEQVDWQALIVAALGPNTSLEAPLPQLLLRLGQVITELTGNAEHLKGFVHGQGEDLEGLAGSMDKRIKARNERRSDLEGRVAELEVVVRLLREQSGPAAVDLDGSKVQVSNLRGS